MDKKKKIERLQLEKFISNESIRLLVHKIENSETPDFEVVIDKKIISIEHTRLINPRLQKIEKYRESIMKMAQQRFEKKYPEKIYALITFRNIELKGGKLAQEKYVEEVYDLIEGIYLNNKNFEFSVDSKRNKEKVSETIKSFSVDNIQNFSHWQHFGAYLVENIDMNWLKNVISKKESNIEKYSKKYEENWLLLVSDFGTKASANNFNQKDLASIESKFDKIFIHNHRADEVSVVK